MFAQISVELQVWDTDSYHRLAGAGCEGVVVYREAYDQTTYGAVHLNAKKRKYAWRLTAPDRAAVVGMRRLGIGALPGPTRTGGRRPLRWRPVPRRSPGVGRATRSRSRCPDYARPRGRGSRACPSTTPGWPSSSVPCRSPCTTSA